MLFADLENFEKNNIFRVTDKNGFLALPQGVHQLPEKYGALEKVLTSLPALVRDENPNAVKEQVENLPIYSVAEDAGDAQLMQVSFVSA